MARAHYPRRGYRLAPASLRELLQVPLPPQYAIGPHRSLRLCDLDESAWERFGDPACKELALEVVRAVGRAGRTPMPIGNRALPALPPGVRLTDLELESRTLNCLTAAGVHERPQDLSAMTIEGVLALRGFWVKCLVDLLTSLEYAIDHPEALKASDLRGGEPAKTRPPADEYPRAGHRVAPRALREILAVPVPPEIAAGTPVAGMLLCDLDESVWDRMSPQRIVRLGETIVARVNLCGCSRAILGRRLPRVPRGLRLEDLRLENRTYNCLRKAGLAEHPEDLGKWTIGQVLTIKAFGAKSLVDLLSVLETVAAREGKLDPRLTAEARRLGAMAEAAEVHFNDPRLGGLLRAIDSEANTVAELAARLVRRRIDPPEPAAACERLGEVRTRIEAFRRLCLEEELLEIFAPAEGRDRRIVAEYYGWDGGGGRTLEELGKKHGLSRERIRQVCLRVIKHRRDARVFAPALDRALGFLAERLPRAEESLRAEFAAGGFSARPVSLDLVAQAAEFLGRGRTFVLVPVEGRRVAVRPEDAQSPPAIVQAARRAVLSFGATTVHDVAERLASQSGRAPDLDLIRQTLQALGDLQWLDPRRQWFQLQTFPQYGLPSMIEKVLSVAGRIDAGRLRAALARYRRAGRTVPPAGVLLEFCRRMPGVCVEGNAVWADPPRAWENVLCGVEAGMVRVLKEHGPVMERGEFEERCSAAEMNPFSFNAVIMSSPVIAQYGRSVYGLVGARVDRRTVEALAHRRAGAVPAKVLSGYGRTDDGGVYLAYRLSKAAISGGVITVPAALKDRICGEFALVGPGGEPVGALVSKGGCAWGLGPVLRARGARPGDCLRLVFSRNGREAAVQIGVIPPPATAG